MKINPSADWLLRLIKGVFIGSGFILPGVSGGALAAVFGIYERLIGFIAHITHNFCKNLLFFFPVGLGAAAGIFLLSFVVSYFLGAWETQILWFFVGCIFGTLPALWKQAGKKGRRPHHLVLLGISTALSYLLLVWGESAVGGISLPDQPTTWLLAGGIIGLGVIVPGLSPSNFLVYLGLYKMMTDGIKTLDLSVTLPLIAGLVVCILLFSRLMDAVFSRAYAGMFHIIFGIVLASTIMIVPAMNVGVRTWIVCMLACAGGILLGWWMSRLEEHYKPVS